MDYCGPRGIPLSQFLAWDPDDQEAALEHSAYESRRYADGTHPDDWNPDAGGSRRAFHTHVDIHPGQQLIDATLASEDFLRAGRGAHVHLVPGSAGECARCKRDKTLRTEED